MNYASSNHPPIRKHNEGFTLTELMVTIVIVIVLASISFAIYGKGRESAHRAACVHILQQYGTAMAGYLSDNHNRMPNFQVNLQKPSYFNENTYDIFGALYPYLGLEKPQKRTALPDNLVCPAWRKRFPNWDSDGSGQGAGNCCFLNQDQSIRGSRVFGSQHNNTPASDRVGGMHYGKIAKGTNQTPMSSILFLADGHHPTEREEPVHGDKRNYLFLDFHVESRRASEVPLGPSK